jgi:hypothetical protein
MPNIDQNEWMTEYYLSLPGIPEPPGSSGPGKPNPGFPGFPGFGACLEKPIV